MRRALDLARFFISATLGSWGGAATLVILAAFLCLSAATFGANTTRGFLWLTLLVIPTLALPLLAASISADRESPFGAALFSSPLTAQEYFLGRCLWIAAIGIIYVFAASPFVFLVAAATMNEPDLITRAIGLGGLNVVAVMGLGLLISVLSGPARSRIPALIGGITAMACIVANTAAEYVNESALTGELRSGIIRFLYLSPVLVAGDLLGISTVSFPPAYLWMRLLLLVTATFAAGFWVFTRLQDPVSWRLAIKPLWLPIALCTIVFTAILLPASFQRAHLSSDELPGLEHTIQLQPQCAPALGDECLMHLRVVLRNTAGSQRQLGNVEITLDSENVKFNETRFLLPNQTLSAVFPASDRGTVFTDGNNSLVFERRLNATVESVESSTGRFINVIVSVNSNGGQIDHQVQIANVAIDAPRPSAFGVVALVEGAIAVGGVWIWRRLSSSRT